MVRIEVRSRINEREMAFVVRRAKASEVSCYRLIQDAVNKLAREKNLVPPFKQFISAAYGINRSQILRGQVDEGSYRQARANYGPATNDVLRFEIFRRSGSYKC